jgi:uncharacterized protein YciI
MPMRWTSWMLLAALTALAVGSLSPAWGQSAGSAGARAAAGTKAAGPDGQGAAAAAAPAATAAPTAGQGGSAPGVAGGAAPASPAPAAGMENLPPDMARYYMVFLRRSGRPKPPDLATIMEGHMANIRRLAAERKLLLAGPFVDQSGTGSLAGIFILAAASLDEARQITASDPAVAAGRFTVEIVPWLGPRSLSRVLDP